MWLEEESQQLVVIAEHLEYKRRYQEEKARYEAKEQMKKEGTR